MRTKQTIIDDIAATTLACLRRLSLHYNKLPKFSGHYYPQTTTAALYFDNATIFIDFDEQIKITNATINPREILHRIDYENPNFIKEIFNIVKEIIK